MANFKTNVNLIDNFCVNQIYLLNGLISLIFLHSLDLSKVECFLFYFMLFFYQVLLIFLKISA